MIALMGHFDYESIAQFIYHNYHIKMIQEDIASILTRFIQSKKEGKDQESIQSSTTPDPGYQWERDNVTIKHHKREQRGQPSRSYTTGYENRSTNDLKCDTRHRGYPGTGIME